MKGSTLRGLQRAEAILVNRLRGTSPEHLGECRLLILHHCAAILGGIRADQYLRAMDVQTTNAGVDPLLAACEVVEVIRGLPVHPVLSLATLCTFDSELTARRQAGVYYTDPRLAAFLAGRLQSPKRRRPLVIDTAAGAGALLAAVAIAFSGSSRRPLVRFVAESIYGADTSRSAIESACLVLAALAGDVGVIPILREHLRCTDSLEQGSAEWTDVAPSGFDAVVGNPPWERLKLTRHEHLAAMGVQRHYGADYATGDLGTLADARQDLRAYLARLGQLFRHQGAGEADMYKLFTELACQLVRPGGQVALLLPGGLIRSQGASDLRRLLLDRFPDVGFFLFSNKRLYFPIDTRFKFVVLHANRAGEMPRKPIRLQILEDAEEPRSEVSMSRQQLSSLSGDLSIPEVRSAREWRLYRQMMRVGVTLGDPDGPWRPTIVREVDMTRDRDLFEQLRSGDDRTWPVVEGRMIHQFRHAVKRYVSGTGRAARWDTVRTAQCKLEPQFVIPVVRLPAPVKARASLDRFGFCDITGQTNERSMLAAWIPAGAVCGNKVPTVTFDGSGGLTPAAVGHTWLAIANSLPFDWLLRRMLTTTVNFFLLLKMGFPDLDPASPRGKALGSLSRSVSRCWHSDRDSREMNAHAIAVRRARMDWLVAVSYGVSFSDLELMLEDFPLLDRSEPPISGERKSTITRDFLFLEALRDQGIHGATEAHYRERVLEARRAGAVAYRASYLDYEGDAA